MRASLVSSVVLLRLRLLIASLGGAALLLVVLCLGAQNLEDRPSLRLGFARMAPLPTGFLVGVALVMGVISGGCSAALLVRSADEGFDQLPGRE
jgi:hypothetical protein